MQIFAYIKYLPSMTGLVQLQDKIVARCALTIYPYSLDFNWLFLHQYTPEIHLLPPL
jgi:hypothetical protein